MVRRNITEFKEEFKDFKYSIYNKLNDLDSKIREVDSKVVHVDSKVKEVEYKMKHYVAATLIATTTFGLGINLTLKQSKNKLQESTQVSNMTA
ncbi:5489_t:CDS:2 [Funneliformis caledonium]|uniref:5489_t:CDS:1 n=1 Tax=Funneliformis caledonium TaxID=1117310 RepID=A0A9N9C334_9GLOM|nr:5489_t:CDS:2 [Funneliformis caledonium]